MSASSYSGNTLACRAALTTINILKKDNLLSDCRRKGNIFFKKLDKIICNFPDLIKSFRGMGFLYGIEVMNSNYAFEIVKEMIKHGVIVLPAYGNSSIIMLEPPIVITDEQINKVIETFNIACNKLC